MIIIGEKINGSIPSAGKAIAARDEAWIRNLAKIQSEANADYIDLCTTLRAGEVAMLPARLSRVLEVGHTSGADGLLGFAAAFCCLI